MRKHIVWCILLTVLALAEANDVFSSGVTAEVVILQYRAEENQGVYRWDSPVFVAYSNHLVVWRNSWAPSVQAFRGSNSKAAIRLAELIANIVDSYSGRTFKLTASSDPHSFTILWSQGKAVKIVGDWRQPTEFHFDNPDAGQIAFEKRANEDERKIWDALPSDIRTLLTETQDFKDTEARPWQPPSLMVRFDRRPNLRPDAIQWPMEWPHEFRNISEKNRAQQVVLPGSMLEHFMRVFPDDGRVRTIKLRGETGFINVLFGFEPGIEAAQSELDNILLH